MKLFRIRGGVHPNERKDATKEKTVVAAPLSARLFLPLQQHIGAPARAIVKVGDSVLKGQVVAVAAGPVSAAIHASTSGTIEAIGPTPVPHASGLKGLAITLVPDGKDEWTDPMPTLPDDAAPEDIAKRVAEAGIVGLGGATFPSAVKLNLRERHNLTTLVMNGAECEPFLTCDDRLMREHTEEVVAGVALMARALGVSRTLIAIESNKPEATEAMIAAVATYPDIDVAQVPTRYPMGSEKHLVHTLTGLETPARALTADIGVVVHNIATAFAVYDAVKRGRPLVSRILTVSGGAIATPMNLKVALGTPIADLIAFCGGFTQEPQEILSGGPMMGQPLRSTDIPTVKGMNGILALVPADTKRGPAHACLRCGTCVTACPCGLLPLEIAANIRNGNFDAAVSAGLMDCIGCGSCAYACPSRLPLVQIFHYAKGHIGAEQRAQQRNEEAKRLAQQKAIRQEKLAAERRALMEKKKAAAAKARATAQGAADQ
ncbi:MAG: electron transport complex subunit RsxC [Rhodospirillaceae bacterium]|nr:electron transport complex subunit RsxC [Rhodospirillaceae bacterium]